MRVVFPAWPGDTRVDAAFEAEAAAAASAGFDVSLVDGLDTPDPVRLVRMPPGEGEALYRGWIVRAGEYRRLAERVSSRGYSLVTSAEAYDTARELPRWYEALGGATPESIWLDAFADLDAVAERVHAAFGDAPVIVKDFVKSRKHEWLDACFIRSAADHGEVVRVTSNFVRLQEDALVGGLVFRRFVELRRAGVHPKSKLPLTHEWRFFVLGGRVVYHAPYWSEGATYEGRGPDVAEVERLVARVGARFYAADVAELEGGGWTIVEINDGGSAGVPEGGDAPAFYAALARAFGG